MRRTLVLLVVSLIVFGSKCQKENNVIPYVPVDITININEPAYFNLLAISGYETVVGGSLGIVIYRKGFDEFVALERHVPYQVEENCRVDVLDDGVTLEDPCSNSQWLIIDGSVLQGPASQPLLQYNTSFNSPYLHIYN